MHISKIEMCVDFTPLDQSGYKPLRAIHKYIAKYTS